ncbi:transcriptional regulator, GntR family [Sinomicrobium oceani]|uniref:Transcriptional regulator, GntR family n=1 Tax=Sinomicrobium oceani TaxID=1150368 RepID=A0A1K1MRN2_9FLAO|nr:PLP-dependent aminotransferase family protein [Sinomicrobium oceani]SFW24630.1 transcriptional regulator, GntR family [Sinomicrobium oceani]
MSNKLNGILMAHGFGSGQAGESLYLELYNAIKKAIIKKKLEYNTRLPPTRLLSQDLGVSRSTVVKAYDILCLENYITSVQGSGYFVNDFQQKKIKYSLKTYDKPTEYPSVSEKARRFRKHLNLMNRMHQPGLAFRPGLPPLDIFPVGQWQQLTNNYWKGVKYSDLSYKSSLGLDSLRKSIVNYLKIYRNIQCHYEQVVIVTGSLHSLSILGELLIDPGDEVIVENPTYANAIAIFRSLKSRMTALEIDEQGLDISDARKKVKNPKLIYTTPSNQYPSGVQMSLQRRLELLEYANARNCLIIEDDYDHEFSNWDNPITSIFGLDKNERVIYQGTFNKLLHPSIRLGYIIVPSYLIEDIKALYEQSLRFVSPEVQKVMSDFIERNYFSRHLRSVLQISRERREFFTTAFDKLFGGVLKILPVSGGLHLIVQLPETIDDVLFSDYLADNGIITFPYSKYFSREPKKNGLIMGFSSVSTPVIKQKLELMYQLYTAYPAVVKAE